jgi:hypothetical protein
MCIPYPYKYPNAQLEGSPYPSSAILTLILSPSEEGAKKGRTSAISNDYIVFLQENEFNIGMIEELIVKGYTDASFLSYLDDLKSQT